MSQCRIDPTIMDLLEMMKLMTEGNPGALSACVALLKQGSVVDPDTPNAGEKCILELDAMNIYGSRLYLLWNDVCKRNLAGLLAFCHAHEYGILDFSPEALDYALYNQGMGIDVDAVIEAIRALLPNFDR